MKALSRSRFGAIALLFCTQIFSAMAVTFTHDAFISFADLSYEGQDIVVTNCTLTVDGPHAFNSLQLQNGAVLTHSPFTYGAQQFIMSVFDEQQTLSAVTPATLNNTNIDTSTIEVMNSAGTIIYTENVDYIVTISNQFTLLTLTTNSAIAEGSMVLVNYDWAEEFQGFDLTINSDVTVAPGAAINVSGKGYAGGLGFLNGTGLSRGTNYPYTFTAGGGAGHGGAGGMSSTFAAGGATYDSTTQPGALGSGGGSGTSTGGSGGGVAILSVGGNVQIDGLVAADGFNGTNAHSGGGAGGSVLITAEDFAGAGIISAKGGSGDLPDGGGGGGGRIAIYSLSTNFNGTFAAFGGNGATSGGAGTVYLGPNTNDTNAPGQLLIVNGGKRGTNTTFSAAAIASLVVSNGAVAQSPASLAVSNLFVGANSWLVATDSVPLILTVTRNATVESNGLISADFRSTSGIGAGLATCGAGSGGGYGGIGGASACGTAGGNSYGSIITPTLMGSPGAGQVIPSIPPTITRGGGAIYMNVAGTLSLAGGISANGAAGAFPNGGGGSGGSVLLNANILSGTGSITANGGSANNAVGGGGGGGRIAVYYRANQFTGNITAYGGAGANAGGAGTVFLNSNVVLNSITYGQLIIDNGGRVGSTILPPPLPPGDLTISGGANVQPPAGAPITPRSLFIGANSWLQAPYGGSMTLTTSNTTIQAGGGILADAAATSPLAGGQTLNNIGGGGGNFGMGGAGTNNAAGGVPYQVNIQSPATPGGSGGSGFAKGGGVIRLTAFNAVQLDGLISANGMSATNLNGGGGGGGSIFISAPTLMGSGTVSANGGAGNGGGGGGGGGGIALWRTTNSFTGVTMARGAAGANYGGAGTVYLGPYNTSSVNLGQIFIDNGGNRGAVTPLGLSGSLIDFSFTGGAVVSNILTSPQYRNLVIGSNSVLKVTAPTQLQMTVTSNVTVQAGGAITVDAGLTSNGPNGPGQSINGFGGGGAGAGAGGNSASNALGGTVASDSITSPILAGSRGGGGTNPQLGGNGGGSLRMTVGGLLRVDGQLSADGAAGPLLNSGGGGGGSLNLSLRNIAGTGIISANGGAGFIGGGGGGGGHIAAVYTGTNTFAGTYSAHGGSGANYGGAGTIYAGTSPSLGAFGKPNNLFLVDNGGVVGAATPLFGPFPQASDYNIVGGAFVTNNATITEPIFGNLLIGSNSTWIPGSVSHQFSLTVNSNAVIQAGGRLTMDGVMPGGQSQGQSGNGGGGGGGHGGYGGTSLSGALGGTITTDTISSPSLPGSQGGASGGYGGGVLLMTVRGALQLDGRISVDGVTGTNLNSGGGSGGGVTVTVRSVTGKGIISANGGAGNNGGGGGGGGRVAFSFSPGSTNPITCSLMARGGAGGHIGGAGTIYLGSTLGGIGGGRPAQVIIDNGGVPGTNTLLSTGMAGTDLIISNGASATMLGTQQSWFNVTISSNATLGLNPTVTGTTMNISGALTVQPGGAISLDGAGAGANGGIGAGGLSGSVGNGAGHGGYGSLGNQTSGKGGGLSYDNIVNPGMPGSGGGANASANSPGSQIGSAGGGALHVTVSGVTTVNGRISANGMPGILPGAGGGSGGSIWLSLASIVGNGKITADGGDGEPFGGGGGGAGGMISITGGSFFTNFIGTLSAHGGAGPFLAGGAGTIYFKTNSANIANLILNNGGAPGTNTPLNALQGVSLSISNGAAAIPQPTGPVSVQNLSIGPGGTFNATPLVPLYLTVLGNALISAGGAINANAYGDSAGTLAGAGSVDFFGDGSGGGYGGAGGASMFGAPGGITYGSSENPVDFGSQGGLTPKLVGFSQGGGAVRLTVNGALAMNGNVSANGADGIITGSGGGSGGSVWVIVHGALSGNGLFTANGGAGESGEGGGGGGGRIAILAPTNSFTGGIFASGGDGFMPGQDGTVFTPTNFVISGTVTDSNGMAVAGFTLQPSNLAGITSDTNGAYALTVPLFWSGSVTPLGNGILVPSIRRYSNLLSNAPNQDFLVTTPAAFNPTGGQFDGTNATFNWYGIQGVTYVVLSSTNLVNWTFYVPSIVGTNGPASVTLPVSNSPQVYFRLQATY